MSDKCKLIVIDGLDGSGKATQTKLICEKLCESGFRARALTFPDYESDSSALVKMYLSGKLGESPDDVNAYAASSFYAVDRVASYLNKWKKDYENCDFIIADRYTTSNIIHQMSKLSESERMDYIEWLFDYEYNRLMIPKPDMVIFLDVDPEVSRRMMYIRYGGDSAKMDIHESDMTYMLRCRDNASWAAKALSWIVVDCCENGEMRTIEDINSRLINIIKDKYYA